jgi:hypothetical protein
MYAALDLGLGPWMILSVGLLFLAVLVCSCALFTCYLKVKQESTACGRPGCPGMGESRAHGARAGG